MSRIVNRTNRFVTFRNEHPEWSDLAYQVLFQKEDAQIDLQYAVAQAMKLAWEMGRSGKAPPRPVNKEARRREEPPADPEVDEIYRSLSLLAWSPLAGTERPEGHAQWIMAKRLAEVQARATPRPSVVPRRQVAPPKPRIVVRRRS